VELAPEKEKPVEQDWPEASAGGRLAWPVLGLAPEKVNMLELVEPA
jgi:hypothetical protein